MPKISELNALTVVPGTDYIAVAHDVTGSPSTNKVLVSNFANSMTSYIGRANTTVYGTLKLGDGLAVNTSTGKVYTTASIPTANTSEGRVLTWDAPSNAPIWQALAPVYEFTVVNDTNLYIVQEHDSIIFADPNAVSDNITIILPIASAVEGKQYFIKNVDPGGQFYVRVTTQEGLDFDSNYVENPVTGTMVVYYDLVSKGDADSWIHDGTVWRHITSQRAVPIFYTSQDTYAQVVFKNASAANNASSDLVGYNNEGNEAEGIGPFIDMGINSNTYTDTTYGNVWGPSDSYLYNYGGNLVIGPQTDHTIKFVAGNTNVEDVRMTISSSNITVNSDIHSTKQYFDFYGRQQVEFSATSSGDGSGNNQAWMWVYHNGSDEAEVGQYAANSTCWSEAIHYNDGRFVHYGIDNHTGKNWDYTIRPFDSYSIGIRPSNEYNNELVILPTGDYDIHLYEGNTGGAVTLGAYGATNFRVYGVGGANNGGGQYGNDIRAELYGNSSFLIQSSNGFNWSFESDGSLTIANYLSLPYKNNVGWNWNYGLNGPTLQLSNNNTQEVIVTGPTPTSSYTNSQRIVIQGQRGYGYWGQNLAGEGGDIYIWGGVGGESDTGTGGSGGDIKIRAGEGQDNGGGYIRIEAGDASMWNGSAVGDGGFIEITAGDVAQGGGDANNHGGNITITAGRGRYDSNKSGSITLRTGGDVNNYSPQYNTVINSDGTISLSANGDIKNSDGISVIKALPQNIQSSFANYTLTLSDAGKHIYKDDGDGYGVEVPTNASVPFEIGTTITIVSGNGWTYIYPVDGMTTEVWGAGYNQTSTSFYIPNNSMATLLKIGTDKWMLSGAGLAID